MFNFELIFSCRLNFNENRGAFIIKSIGIIIANIIRNWMSVNIGNWLKFMWGIAAKNIPNAGVGKPINELDCLLSILNLAKR